MDITVPDVVREASLRAGTLDPHTQARPGAAQYLTFQAAQATYAVGIGAIREIIEHSSITAIPLMPRFIRGIINLRGAVVPVIELSARLGFEAVPTCPRSCIVIVEMSHEDERFEMGLVVDGVSEVIELGAADLEPPPTFGANIRSDFIQNMARVHGRFVIVLRLEQVLSIEEVSQLARNGKVPQTREWSAS